MKMKLYLIGYALLIVYATIASAIEYGLDGAVKGFFSAVIGYPIFTLFFFFCRWLINDLKEYLNHPHRWALTHLSFLFHLNSLISTLSSTSFISPKSKSSAFTSHPNSLFSSDAIINATRSCSGLMTIL